MHRDNVVPDLDLQHISRFARKLGKSFSR
uniref:Uncharacterized protein n=1 Tax=Rhizophora mucronata TaxID=61149 RepID=A0A2P2PXH1_RHIMU